MIIIGIDEVGRGCWAGPLVVGAVAIDSEINGITDSKLLSDTKRRLLNAEIKSKARSYAMGWVSSGEVDKLGLTMATQLAINRALHQIKVNYDQIIIDGSVNFLPNNPKVITMVKADMLVLSVGAASILAKVARDDYMIKMSSIYPNYGFESHVGYGTRLHHDRLRLFGACELHRLSFKPVAALDMALGVG